ncbi:hypothetical protein [Psychroserpens algicola]|uniref:Uncharacterized protein n=1 Tax=Psychroserpens algicola TaxID=1719034 RepID=A0ABT0H7U4_9FLAO|nr:hypothetical protein [Psychroserpens algicola]MCK8480426.1 hypothetical protein [Psychroserpens algicola]
MDEEKEDPEVHILSPFLAKGNDEPLLKKSIAGTFSNLINEAVHRIKNDIPF